MQKQTPPQPRPRPQSPLNYPDGVAVSNELGHVYLIRGDTKHKLFSQRVVDSWNFSVVLRGSVESLRGFKNGPVLGFRNGTLVKNISDQKMYLISQNKRRHVQSPEFFDDLGFEWDEYYLVSEEEVNLHEEGEVIS